MTDHLQELLQKAQAQEMTAEQREHQRRSFAYGNTKIENPQITKQVIDEAADELASRKRSHGAEHDAGR